MSGHREAAEDWPRGKDVLDGYEVEKKLGEGLGNATKFWAVFGQSLQKYKDASEEQRKEKKLADPRFGVTFVVTETKPGQLVGDAKTPLAKAE